MSIHSSPPPSQASADAAPTRGASALLTTIDQVLSSGSNALMVFALARISSVEQFGVVALLVAGMAALLGFNRGALGTVLLLTSNLAQHWVVSEARYAMSWAVGSGVLAGVALLAVGCAFGQPVIGLAFAVSMPFLLAQDALRFAAIALGRPMVAVRSDVLWLVVTSMVFGATLFAPVRPVIVIAVWGAGGLIALLLIAIPLRVRLRRYRVMQWWRTYQRGRVRFGALYTVIQVNAFFITLIATFFIGSVAAAGLRGAAAIFGPIAMLVSALPLVFIPHARRTAGSTAQQWRALTIASTVSSGITVVITVALVLLPGRLGSALLGPTWDQAHPLIPMIGIESVAMCWIVSVYSYFQTQGLSRQVVRLNVIQCALQLGSCLLTALVIGTAAGIASALALSGVVSTVIGVMLVVASMRDGRSADVPIGPRVADEVTVP